VELRIATGTADSSHCQRILAKRFVRKGFWCAFDSELATETPWVKRRHENGANVSTERPVVEINAGGKFDGDECLPP
jgi:hypothetical protein